MAASDGPLFVTPTVYVAFVVTVTFDGPLFVTTRSAVGATVASLVEELFPPFGSAVVALTSAVFEIVLPLGTEAKVTNLATGQSVQVTINDRGPYVPGRQLDLSKAAAAQIGLTTQGLAQVKIEAKRPSAKTCTKFQRDAGKCRNSSKRALVTH